MPHCLSLGVKESEFWKLNPRKVNHLIKAERLKLDRQLEYDNAIAHIQGAYIAEAILSTVVNALSSKNSKKYEYPAKPYDVSANRESENDKQLELFKAQLNVTMNNFNLAHGKGVEG